MISLKEKVSFIRRKTLPARFIHCCFVILVYTPNFDETFLKQTQNFHGIGVLPTAGKHRITALDAIGNEIAVTITIE